MNIITGSITLIVYETDAVQDTAEHDGDRCKPVMGACETTTCMVNNETTYKIYSIVIL